MLQYPNNPLGMRINSNLSAWHADASEHPAVRYCCRFACGIRAARRQYSSKEMSSGANNTLSDRLSPKLTRGYMVRAGVRREYGRRGRDSRRQQVVATEEEGRGLGREGRHAGRNLGVLGAQGRRSPNYRITQNTGKLTPAAGGSTPSAARSRSRSSSGWRESANLREDRGHVRLVVVEHGEAGEGCKNKIDKKIAEKLDFFEEN